jgi:two-component system cell cycle response regulator DivK
MGTNRQNARFSEMGRRILVVEDDLLNRMFYCEVLQREGYEVKEVDDGAIVMDRARDFDPDLVIMDINLPHVSGIELIERLKADQNLADAPVLAITAYVGRAEEARIREAGAAEYLSKPVSMKTFVSAIQRLLPKH